MVPNQTLIGSHTVFFEETASTNDSLKLLYSHESLPEGAVVYTNYQITGRGQQGARWESESGKNLLMSVLLLPDFLHADEQLWLNVCICLALRETVEQLLKKATYIKWPNDIYAAHKKVGGILLENVLQGNKIKHTIVGIGLNINQGIFETKKASSLSLLAGKQFDLHEVRKIVCEKLGDYYTLLRQKQWPSLWSLYHKHLYGRGEMAWFVLNDEKIEAQILGLDKQGRLHLLINDEVQSFANKEIVFLSLK